VRLAAEGFDVVVNYLRNEDAARETVDLVKRHGREAWAICANMGDTDEIAALFRELGRHVDKLDVLVHNAAIGTFKPLFEIRPNQLELAFRVNVFALLWLAKAAVPMMGRGGKIIALSSAGAGRAVPYYGIVGPSKAALESMTRYLAAELMPRGIAVNAVSGGLIDTDALRAFPDWEKLSEQSIAQTPAGRLGTGDDLAAVVASLASGKLDWVCGQVIMADGGAGLR
jgi:enoyl-[acyl-carrier protein] reductase III